ncbi:hypothetical protein O0L34_g14785 [Tuta absoluta]|nr:hypothetical protein O0L34_g14785 [Tuta absoluta]
MSKYLLIGTWNVRTLLDNDVNLCPERKTALIARELARYNIDIAAISETHLSDTGELCERLGGYTYYWSGKPITERAASGVGFAVRNEIAKTLQELPKGIYDRIITLRLQLSSKKYLHLISVYAPTLPSSDEDKAKFYCELNQVLNKIPSTDKIILFGDFNARVGNDYGAWNGVLGRHGVGKCNANGLDLLTLCAEHDLTITNTCYRMPDKFKTTWMHPRSKHWHLLDYVIVRKRDLGEVLVTRAMRGAQGWTDHRLVRSKLRVKIIAPHRAAHKVSAKIHCKKLINNQHLAKELDDAFGSSMPEIEQISSVDERWRLYAENLHKNASRVIGKPERKNQDWFDESDMEIKKLVEDHRRTLNSSDVSERRSAHQSLKIKVRALKDKWWVDKANEIQLYADTNQSGRFFENLQAVFGPRTKKTAPIYNKDKTERLTEQKHVLARWAEHFNDVLNPSTQTTDLLYIESLENLPTVEDLAEPPSFDEFFAALKRMKNHKSPGADGIPAELYKYGGPHIKNKLFELVLNIWECEIVPQDWRDASICKLYKGKGDIADCSSYRGISLLSTAGKILAHIINTRLSRHAESILPETQCGFRPGRGTVDAIFVVRQIQEKSLEQHRHLYMCFVDLEKAFDRVPREALWIVLKKAGCPEKLLNLIRQFHENMTVRVRHENNFSDRIPVTSGVKQGCVLAPTLFSLYFASVMRDAATTCSDQIEINSRTDKSVFDLSRFRAKRQVVKLSIRDILYADDVCLMADSIESLQTYVNSLQVSCRKFGLVISTSKTQILKQPARGCRSVQSSVTLNNSALEEVSNFKYLGSRLRCDNTLASEIPARIAGAAAAFGKLKARVWNSHDLKLQTKMLVYKAIVLPTLLYAAETWCCYKTDIKQLDTFHLKCLRSILRIKWQDRISNTEVLRRSGMSGIEALIIKHQLRWSGHVLRMPDNRLPKAVFYSELSSGKRKQGGQYLRYKDVIKRNLVACNIPTETWESRACLRPEWRQTIHKSVERFETQRLKDLDVKRQIRKTKPKLTYTYTYNSAGQLYCASCNRVFKTKFGFASHIRSHRNKDPIS